MTKNDFMRENSIKQILRMPVKTFSFFILITSMGFLLSLAAGMYIKTIANIKGYKQSFKTIGTVSQTAMSMSREAEWDSRLKTYRIRQTPVYGELLPVSVLDFDGAGYIIPPEKRSYYASYSPEYKIAFSDVINYRAAPLMNPVVEFSPLEDCIPDHSVLVQVTKVLFGHMTFNNFGAYWFCDHNTENPQMLYKDKTYIAKLKNMRQAHGETVEKKVPERNQGITFEYHPEPLTFNAYDEAGKSLIKDKKEYKPYYEVTDGFYDSPVGKMYLNYAKGLEMRNHTFPVTGTNSINLLLPFYNDNVFIKEGRDISKEAYEKGLNECLISDTFAQNNDLEIGDSVTTNLLFTDCKNAAEENYYSEGAVIFDFTMLMDSGELPHVFETKSYTVVGIYDAAGYGMNDPKYQLGSDEMIVPLNSIENRGCNILSYGPMNELTTSFQIPNGSIDSFMEKWESLNINNIELTFYDKGYTKLEKGMDNMRFMAVIFGIVGIVLGAVLLFFYSRMFIGGQKVRITIERCLGLNVSECRRSLLFGAMLVLFVGSAAGCILGTMFSGTASVYDIGKEIFDTTFTAGQISAPDDIVIKSASLLTNLSTCIVCEAVILLTGFLILYKDINSLLKQEPLYLIDDINRE